MAFATSLESKESAGRWAALLEHDTTGAWPALDESFQLVSRFLGRSRGALGSLSASGVLRVLQHATAELPTSAIHLDATKNIQSSDFLNSISGIYRAVRKGGVLRSFIRDANDSGGKGQD